MDINDPARIAGIHLALGLLMTEERLAEARRTADKQLRICVAQRAQFSAFAARLPMFPDAALTPAALADDPEWAGELAGHLMMLKGSGGSLIETIQTLIRLQSATGDPAAGSWSADWRARAVSEAQRVFVAAHAPRPAGHPTDPAAAAP